MKRTKGGKVLYIIFGLCILLCLNSCGKEKISGDLTTEEQQQETTAIADDQIYILLYSDEERKIVFLESIVSGVQEEFTYSGGTYVYDRYGGNSIMSELKIGSLLEVSYTDNKMLTEIRETAQASVYDGITKFKIDEEKRMIAIGGSNYYYDEKLKVFSDTNLISIGEIAEGDTISIREMNREILTIVIDKGHGMVRLKNTEKFRGGMITIGNVIAQEIVQNMELEVPEGTYMLSVANQGYGGSREITVNRFEKLEIDLSELEGEGPDYCKLKIDITPSKATVRLNGEKIDCSEPLELRFGSYQLSAKAEGYEDWGGRLVISSDEATVTIQMKEIEKSKEEEENDESKEEDSQENESSGSSSSVEVDSSNHNDSNNTNNSTNNNNSNINSGTNNNNNTNSSMNSNNSNTNSSTNSNNSNNSNTNNSTNSNNSNTNSSTNSNTNNSTDNNNNTDSNNTTNSDNTTNNSNNTTTNDGSSTNATDTSTSNQSTTNTENDSINQDSNINNNGTDNDTNTSVNSNNSDTN